MSSLEVRLFKAFEGFRASGLSNMPGGIVNGLPANTADPNTWDFAGSSLVVVAESQAEVVKLLEQDIYTKSGVWDVPKVCIPPGQDRITDV